MGLTCECGWDGEGWTYREPADYSVLSSSRRKRCCSCKALIDVGATVVEFERSQQVHWESVKAKIYGDDYEEELASWFMCEECGDLFFSLKDLGFCIYLDAESMPELLKEYHAAYGSPQ